MNSIDFSTSLQRDLGEYFFLSAMQESEGIKTVNVTYQRLKGEHKGKVGNNAT